MPLSLTLDTNCIDHAELLDVAAWAQADVASASVTRKELAGSPYDIHLTGVRVLPEQEVWKDGVWDDRAWADRTWASGPDIPYATADGVTKYGDPFEDILKVISNGGSPPVTSRGTLTRGQRRQLRDAMILSLHAQHKRDVFVSADARAFIADGRRRVLERMLGTRICTPDEVIALLI
jgi:hypothetical protein